MEDLKKLAIFSNWKIYMRSRNEVSYFVKKLTEDIKPKDFDFLDIFIIPDFISFEILKFQYFYRFQKT